MPYQRGGVTPAAGLYTVGVPWQSRRSSAILLGIERDAQAVAARIAGRQGAERRSAVR
jgi:putative flavoprotein involved in K+ transport